jgi:hypothetical protein
MISPKVALPAFASLIVGFGLLVAGIVTHDDTLKTAAVTVLLAAVGQGAIGYQAPHPVPVQTVEASDDLLPPKVVKKLVA